MAEVMDMPPEALDRRRERQTDRKEKTSEELPRKRDRDSRERRDEGDPNRRGDHYERNRSPSRDREREYRRRSSPSPPPYVSRERWHSPSRHSPPPFKRGRRDDGYDHRRSSPRGGFGSDDRRFGYDYVGGDHDREGRRPGYHD